MADFAAGMGLGAALAWGRFKVLILVPLLVALGAAAVAQGSIMPILSGLGVQVGYLLSALLIAWWRR